MAPALLLLLELWPDEDLLGVLCIVRTDLFGLRLLFRLLSGTFEAACWESEDIRGMPLLAGGRRAALRVSVLGSALIANNVVLLFS